MSHTVTETEETISRLAAAVELVRADGLEASDVEQVERCQAALRMTRDAALLKHQWRSGRSTFPGSASAQAADPLLLRGRTAADLAVQFLRGRPDRGSFPQPTKPAPRRKKKEAA